MTNSQTFIISAVIFLGAMLIAASIIFTIYGHPIAATSNVGTYQFLRKDIFLVDRLNTITGQIQTCVLDSDNIHYICK